MHQLNFSGCSCQKLKRNRNIYTHKHTHTQATQHTHRILCNGPNGFQGISETSLSLFLKSFVLCVCFILLSRYKLASYASLFERGTQLPINPKFYTLSVSEFVFKVCAQEICFIVDGRQIMLAINHNFVNDIYPFLYYGQALHIYMPLIK